MVMSLPPDESELERKRPKSMSGKILKILDRPGGCERVLLVIRNDGNYTFQRQWLSGPSDSGNRDLSDGKLNTWGAPGPDCGIYESIEGAEQEARLRIDWLQSS
jgi:hypothetical protein